MKKKLLSKTLSVFTAMVLVFASAAVPAYAQDGDYSLGAAHPEPLPGTRSQASSGNRRRAPRPASWIGCGRAGKIFLQASVSARGIPAAAQAAEGILWTI